MARVGVERKLARHLKISDKEARKLVAAGFRKPSAIKAASKRKLRDDAGLSQKEADAVKKRWA